MKNPKSGICLAIVWVVFSLLGQGCSDTNNKGKLKSRDRLVVLTFDDAVSTHYSFVAPLLKEYGFGATFYVCEFPPDFEDKQKYMSWAQIQELHEMGFEIGNHTKTHTHVNDMTTKAFVEELKYIEEKCRSLNITKPNTFAYPAYDTDPLALDVLLSNGYSTARIGGSRAYYPERDHPYLIPSYSTTGSDTTQIMQALRQAGKDNVIILTIHGVPDYAHDWVTTPPELFELYLEYLDEYDYTVISMRDLAKYVDFENAMNTITPDWDQVEVSVK